MRFSTSVNALAAVVFSACSLGAMAATNVSAGGTGGLPSTGTLTTLGTFEAGTYQITATGTVDLVGNGTFTMNPDGKPTTAVTAPGYTYFNSAGSNKANGYFGQAGSGVLIGSLIGTFSANPTSPTDWFLIGYSKTVTFASQTTIYASVNDIFHSNNTGAFSVNVTAVPEPESYAMMLAGLGLMGVIARRRAKTSA